MASVQVQHHDRPQPPYGKDYQSDYRDRYNPSHDQQYQKSTTSQILSAVSFLAVGGGLILLAALTFAGTIIGITIATPLFVIFSPVLVPAVITIGLVIAGFLTSGAFGISGIASLTWLVNYIRKARPQYDTDYLKQRFQETADQWGQKARETGQSIQDKAREGVRRHEGGDQPYEGGFFGEGRLREGGLYGEGRSREGGVDTSHILAVVTLLPIGGTLLLLSGLTLAGTLIGLAVATPLFVIFSPVLVPAAILIGLSIAGILTSGAFGITGLSSLSWVTNYLRKLRPQGDAEYLKESLQDAAWKVGQKTKETGESIQHKAYEGGAKGQEGGGGGGEKIQVGAGRKNP